MHCLPPAFSSASCSDTEEVCLAASETILSSNQRATTMVAIISLSGIFLSLHFLKRHPAPPFLFNIFIQMDVLILRLTGWNHNFGSSQRKGTVN